MIALVRHPRAAVAAGVCYGRTDLPLGDPADIPPIATALRGHSGIVWTSPARRCRMVADALGAPREDVRLLELDFGAWEGLRWDEIPRQELDRWAVDHYDFAPPGGESGAALTARVRAFRDELATGDHVVVTHGGVLKVLIPLLRGEAVDLMAPPPALGSITRIG